MSFLAEARNDLKNLLTGYKVYEWRPESVTPPALVIETGDPFLISGQTFGEWSVSFSVTLLLPPSTNKASTERMDTAIVDIAERLRGAWSLTSVNTGIVTLSNNDYASAVFNINSNLSKD